MRRIDPPPYSREFRFDGYPPDAIAAPPGRSTSADELIQRITSGQARDRRQLDKIKDLEVQIAILEGHRTCVAAGAVDQLRGTNPPVNAQETPSSSSSSSSSSGETQQLGQRLRVAEARNKKLSKKLIEVGALIQKFVDDTKEGVQAV